MRWKEAIREIIKIFRLCGKRKIDEIKIFRLRGKKNRGDREKTNN